MSNCSRSVVGGISLLVIGASQSSKETLRSLLTDQLVNLTFVNSAYEAKLCILQDISSAFDAYLFDNNEHYTENLALLKALKKNGKYAVVPVIFQADLEAPQQVQQSLDNGVYFYLLKPYTQAYLLSVLKSAVLRFDNQKSLNKNLISLNSRGESIEPTMQTASFHIKTIDDARSLSSALAFVTPKPQEAVIGLFELMLNAIEHGNLNISYQEKSDLIRLNQFQAEIKRRQNLPENGEKMVTVHFARKPNELQFTISDMGQGFDYKTYLDFSTKRAMDSHGRGVMIANKLSFDTLQYEDNGCTAIGRILI